MGTPLEEYYHRRIVDALYYLKFELHQPITGSSWIERWIARAERREILRMVGIAILNALKHTCT